MSIRRSGLALVALLASIILLPSQARAETVAIGTCTYHSDADCTTTCGSVDFSAICTGSGSGMCSGSCDGEAETSCMDSCATSCMTECTTNPGTFSCSSFCETDCSGHCESACHSNPSGDHYCQSTPPSTECDTVCGQTCEATCKTEANLECNLSCSATLTGSCDVAQAAADCTTECASAGGILVCDGKAQTYGTEDDARGWVQTHGSGGVKVDANVNCHLAGFGGPPPAIVGMLGLTLLAGLALLGSRRRPRR
jgi:hypothetical protein